MSMPRVSKSKKNVPVPHNRTDNRIHGARLCGDFDDRPIEPLERERVECRLEGVLLQLALQVLDGNLLTDRQPLVAVRAEVDAGKVAAQRSVRSELVQLAYDGQVTLSSPFVLEQPLLSDSFKGNALFGRPRQLLIVGRVRVQHCLEDGDACPRDGGVPCGPRRVRRASLGVLRREEQRLVAPQSTSEGEGHVLEPLPKLIVHWA